MARFGVGSNLMCSLCLPVRAASKPGPPTAPEELALRRRRSQHGSGTLLGVAVLLVLVFAMAVVSQFAGAASTRWATQTAADLAALTAAQDLIDGQSLAAACAHGAEVANANGSRLTSCRPAPAGRIAITTDRETPAFMRGLGRATAMAGPPPMALEAELVGGSNAAAALAALNWARNQIGRPYLWGGTGPSAFDCSGLVQQAYLQGAGQVIPRVAQAQSDAAIKVPFGQMRPGDLLFWVDNTGVHHVALFAGEGMMVEAPSSGKLVREVPIRWPGTTAWAGRF